jgi:predicted esterase
MQSVLRRKLRKKKVDLSMVWILCSLILFVASIAMLTWTVRGNNGSDTSAVAVVSPSPSPSESPKTSVGGVLRSVTDTQSYSFDQVRAAITSSIPSAQQRAPLYDVDRYTARITSTDANNKEIEIVVQYFVPKLAQSQQLPMYVFGSGTTGIADRCAPSRENVAVANWGNYTSHMLAYASQGYIGVFTDYEGFNDPSRIHHYFHAEHEARVMLDAARAASLVLRERQAAAAPTSSIFLTGYSQGGHAAYAARDAADRYAPELKVLGVIGYAPAVDVAALLREAPALAPYLITAYADTYGKQAVDASKMLQERWLSSLERDMENICVDKVYQHYPGTVQGVYQPAFALAVQNNTLSRDFPGFAQALSDNFTGKRASKVPSLVLQGATDPIVTAGTVKAAVRDFCALGNIVQYREYPGVNHFRIRSESFKDTTAWMSTVLSGQKPPSTCAS